MEKRDWIRICSRIIFVFYMIVLVYFLLLSDGFGRTVRRDELHYNLIPFVEIIRFVKYREYIGYYYVLINLLGNVVAFIPFGALIRWIIQHRIRWFHVMFYTMLFSLSVELLQLVARVGSFDVDDLILNTIGGVLGYFIYYLLRLIDQKVNMKQEKRR